PAGDSGPCGPCSELHYDFGKEAGCGSPDCSPSCSCGRFCEIWNLVFVQYNQDKTGKRTPLAKGHIDTGMGLERITVIMQNKNSVYETDLFVPLLDGVSKLSGIKYGSDSNLDNNMRVVAEHGRAGTFLIADGVLPGNEKRGYVLRRLMRRAIFFGEKLGAGRSFLTEVAKITIDKMKHEYPELGQKRDFIFKVIKEEESRFRDTLKTGTQLLEGIMAKVSGEGKKQISGEQSFKLYDTYGFPVDLTQEVARKQGFTVDMAGFEAEMNKQRERAKASHRFKKSLALSADVEIVNGCVGCEFTGYESLQNTSLITGLIIDNDTVGEISEGQEASIILDKTPFYAEMGGQVGDTGEITGADDRFVVKDTIKISQNVIAHKGYVAQGVFKSGDKVTASVDTERRLDIARNHTATHLLQYALRKVLGEHVQQRGSLVAPDKLRFDFSHLSAMTGEEIEKVQSIVNNEIRRNHAVCPNIMPYKQAIKEGATALFDEKYGDEVRVLKIGNPIISAELCGGTHISATGEIGYFQILAESSIGGGIRRIEAVTGRGAEWAIKNNVINLKNEAIAIQSELDKERKQVQVLQHELAKQEAASLLDKVETINNINLLASRVSVADNEMMRDMADVLRNKLVSGIVVLGAVIDDKPSFIAAVTPDLVKKRYNAGKIVKHMSCIAGGGGGGKPDIAQGGGRDIDKLDEAINSVRGLI
ncbi:MAG: alanine--tRNA ligase, partial [Dehalococcoidales bacterium]|nr:alanine--tRNA ligase [Dehalococcoidales bacterium]